MKHWLSIFVVLAVSMANAATYYVDFATGSDANNGTSTSTPFQHAPGDANCTDTAAATTLAAGDTVKFKGGVVYVGTVVVAWSGGAGTPITYDGNISGDWGTGRAVIDRDYLLNGVCISAPAGINNITIRNLELRNAGGWADDDPDVIAAAAGTLTNTVNTGGMGVDFYTGKGHTNIYLSDLYLHRIGGWRNTQGWTANTINGAGIVVRNGDGITITNCEMTKVKAAIGIYVQTGVIVNVEVVDCNIHNYITWGIDVAPQTSGDTLKNISLHDSQIHDYAEFVSGNWEGNGEWPHTDGIFLRTAGTPSVWDNVRVFNNDFFCDGDRGDGGTASIYVSEGASASIFNNVFNQDSQTRIIGVEHDNVDASEQIVRIYNNTIISDAPHVSMLTETNPAERRIFIANNLFIKPTGTAANNTMVTRLSGVEPEVMDFNLYHDPDWTSATKRTHVWPGSDYIFFDNVFTSIGFEENGLYADPDFVSFVATPSACDLSLQSGSPAIGTGTNLSAYFTTDKNGVARGSTWDIGAYEYQPSRIWNVTTLNAVNANVGGSQ